MRVFIFLATLFNLLLSFNGEALASEKKMSTVEGTYQVKAIEKNSDGVVIRFQKISSRKEDKIIELEMDALNENLIQKGSILDITAVVADEGASKFEAQQVLLNLPRNNGKTRVWLLSKKRKMLNFDNATLLKMHGTESDYYIL